MAKKTTKKANASRPRAKTGEEKMHPTALARHRAATREAADRFRKKKPAVIGMRGSGDASYPIEDVMPDPEYPAWLIGKFKDPRKVVIFQSLNPGLLLSVEESEIFYDNKMRKVEKKGFIANFAKSRGFFATDNQEIIKSMKASERYGAGFWDVEDAKKAAQQQNFNAFLADVQDNPMLLKKLTEEAPEKIRTIFRRLVAASDEEFEEDELEEEEPPEPEGGTPEEPVEGDDFEE